MRRATPPLHLLKSEIINPFPPLPTQSSVHPVHSPLKIHQNRALPPPPAPTLTKATTFSCWDTIRSSHQSPCLRSSLPTMYLHSSQNDQIRTRITQPSLRGQDQSDGVLQGSHLSALCTSSHEGTSTLCPSQDAAWTALLSAAPVAHPFAPSVIIQVTLNDIPSFLP